MAKIGDLFKNVITLPTVSKNGDYPAKIAKFTRAQDASYVTLKPYLKTKKGEQKFASILFKIEDEVEANSPQSQFVNIFKHADSDEDVVGHEVELTIKVGHSEKGSYPNIMKVKAKKAKAKAVVTEEDDIEEDEDLEIDEEVDVDDEEDLEVEADGEDDEDELEED